MRRVLAIALIALLGMLLVPGARAPLPTLTISSPMDGEVIGGGSDVVVHFSLTDFTLVQPGMVGQVNNATEGHLAVYVDGTLARHVTRVEPIVLSLVSGPHEVLLQLQGNDGGVLGISDSVLITATSGPAVGTPGVEILYPPYDLATGHDVYVAARVTNFTLVAPDGRPNAPNEGHMIFLLNDEYFSETASAQPAFLVDLPDGHVTFTVRLVNNDGSPLTPDVSDSTRVYIKGANPMVSELIGGSTVVLLLLLLFVVARRRLVPRDAGSRGDPEPSEDPKRR